jgi:alkylhydroperoxidase family enzyme
MRYENFQRSLVAAVLNAPGDTSPALRSAAMQRGALPAPVASYVDKVARHAYTVTDADVSALHQAGHSDDSIFEITVAATVGAALYRLERGMAALRGEEPD